MSRFNATSLEKTSQMRLSQELKKIEKAINAKTAAQWIPAVPTE
jgi:hypothetical protein